MLETLDEKSLDIKLVSANRSIPGEGKLSDELTHSLEVLLDLTQSARCSTNFIGDLVEFDFIDEKAALEDLGCDQDRP